MSPLDLRTRPILERRAWPRRSSNSMMMIEGGHRHPSGYSTLLTASLSSEARGCTSMIRCRCYKAHWMRFIIHVDGAEEEDLSLIFCTAVLTRLSARRSSAWPRRNSTRLSCPRTLKLRVLQTRVLVRAKTITGSIFTKTIFKGSNIKTNFGSRGTFHRVWPRKRHLRRNLRTTCIKWMPRKSKSKKK